jgi:hypothetical protein
MRDASLQAGRAFEQDLVGDAVLEPLEEQLQRVGLGARFLLHPLVDLAAVAEADVLVGQRGRRAGQPTNMRQKASSISELSRRSGS